MQLPHLFFRAKNYPSLTPKEQPSFRKAKFKKYASCLRKDSQFFSIWLSVYISWWKLGWGEERLGWKCNCVCVRVYSFWLFRTAVHLRNRQLLHTTFKLFMTSLLFQVYMLLWNCLLFFKKVLFETLPSESTDSHLQVILHQCTPRQ
jgi:hypothetical protein